MLFDIDHLGFTWHPLGTFVALPEVRAEEDDEEEEEEEVDEDADEVEEQVEPIEQIDDFDEDDFDDEFDDDFEEELEEDELLEGGDNLARGNDDDADLEEEFDEG